MRQLCVVLSIESQHKQAPCCNRCKDKAQTALDKQEAHKPGELEESGANLTRPDSGQTEGHCLDCSAELGRRSVDLMRLLIGRLLSDGKLLTGRHTRPATNNKARYAKLEGSLA